MISLAVLHSDQRNRILSPQTPDVSRDTAVADLPDWKLHSVSHLQGAEEIRALIHRHHSASSLSS